MFRWLLVRAGERRELAAEVGVRLGQGSEFALLIAALALHREVMGERAAYLIQVFTLITFIASSYLIMWRYPTPIAGQRAAAARLIRDTRESTKKKKGMASPVQARIHFVQARRSARRFSSRTNPAARIARMPRRFHPT